jgi:hypothetical protein
VRSAAREIVPTHDELKVGKALFSIPQLFFLAKLFDELIPVEIPAGMRQCGM